MHCFFERLTNKAYQRNMPIIGNIIFIIFLINRAYIGSGTWANESEVLNTSVRTGETESAIYLSIRLFIISGPHALPTWSDLRIEQTSSISKWIELRVLVGSLRVGNLFEFHLTKIGNGKYTKYICFILWIVYCLVLIMQWWYVLFCVFTQAN